jgi:ribonuclease HII
MTTKTKTTSYSLNIFHNESENVIEIGVDEAGRGPLFGRVYTAAVILPKDDSFNHSKMKDSKKFHSHKKLIETAEYIKKNAIAWHISYKDENDVDNLNILQATQQSMHESILEVMSKYSLLKKEKDTNSTYNYNLLIDGNYFNTITTFNKQTKRLDIIPHICIEGGDNKYTCIAAASILAKVSRDEYINDLCLQYPKLSEYYSIDTNKGYGAKKHLDGIKTYGITKWHRKSFGICKTSSCIDL